MPSSRIISISKKLFEDGHYANAAADAFIEINDRVKKLFFKRMSGMFFYFRKAW